MCWQSTISILTKNYIQWLIFFFFFNEERPRFILTIINDYANLNMVVSIIRRRKKIRGKKNWQSTEEILLFTFTQWLNANFKKNSLSSVIFFLSFKSLNLRFSVSFANLRNFIKCFISLDRNSSYLYIDSFHLISSLIITNDIENKCD